MAVGNDVTVLGQDHAGAGECTVGRGAGNGHHRVNDAGIDLLQREPSILGNIFHTHSAGIQHHGFLGRRFCRGDGNFFRGNGSQGGGIFVCKGNRQGFLVGILVNLPEQPDIHNTQNGDDTGEQDHKHQQQRDESAAAFGRPGRACAIGVLIPGILFRGIPGEIGMVAHWITSL